MISFDQFKTVELKAVKVLTAERVVGSDKLLKLQVDDGSTNLPAGRQVIAGIGKKYTPEAMIGRMIIIVANLEPRSLMGLESQGMLLAAQGTDGPVFLTLDGEVPAGAPVS